jgi:hypothetical protein
MADRLGVEPSVRGFGVRAACRRPAYNLKRCGETDRIRTGVTRATFACLNHSATASPQRFKMARESGVEPLACGFVGRCSIRLSYSRKNGLGGWNRTTDLVCPRHALYH